ncbi:proton-coupled folate transporter-like [Sycon ciliatum]|uniref:proton-coupled folate transporter-like n=1 Tax=Sycon ciliatum TaxID=27933 RepID=UPI0031F6CDA3
MLSGLRKYASLVTVEPSLFLYMFGTFMFYPLLQNMVYSHYSNGAHSDNASNASNASTCGLVSSVSAHTSHFIFYLTLSSILPGALSTLLLGRWSDSSGRKLLMALPAAGAAFNAIVSLLVYKLTWNINILLLGGLGAGLLGSYAMFNQASFAYVADISSAQHRTRRLGILEAMIYLGMTTGSEVGGVWTEQHGYGPPFWGVIVTLILVLAYVVFVVREAPLPQSPSHKVSTRMYMVSILHGFRLFTKPSPQRKSRLVILLAFVFATINFNALIDVTIPYLRDDPFHWQFDVIGHYLALGNFMHGISALAILPGLLHLGLSDITCIQVGIISSMLSLILLGLAQRTWLVFLVPIVGTLRGMVVPCVRANLSKFVKADEHGALFSSIAIVEICCTAIASLIYNNAYPATCSILPSSHGFVFILMSVCLLPPLCMFWWVGRQTPANDAVSVPVDVQDDGLSETDKLLQDSSDDP